MAAPASPIGERRSGAFADPLHARSAPDAHWSTANIGEASPGVSTPLGWTLWGPASECCVRRTFHGFGVLEADETGVPLQEARRTPAS